MLSTLPATSITVAASANTLRLNLSRICSHLVLIFFVLLLFLPLYLALIAASNDAIAMMKAPLALKPGTHLWQNFKDAF